MQTDLLHTPSEATFIPGSRDCENPCRPERELRILIISQVYHPDVVSTAQHLTDFGNALSARGHDVRVITSDRAYDNPKTRFSRKEIYQGVGITRLRSTGFGKGAKWKRALDFGSFILASLLRVFLGKRPDVVIAMTSPPLISCVGALYSRVVNCRFLYWVMDLNPDEAVAAGWLTEGSTAESVLDSLSRYSLRRASKVIVLDRYMRERILGKGIPARQIEVIPPWSHNDSVSFDPIGRNEFRRSLGIDGKFVIMYSGNHSPCHPLDTMLDAARVLKDDPRFTFCFIGGGSKFPGVQEFARSNALQNVVCLPYQPLSKLSASLSAADLHVVVMGNPFVGTIHPCKVYNIMTVGTPFIYVGPSPSHISDILQENRSAPGCAQVAHGDAAAFVAHIQRVHAAKNAQGPQRALLQHASRFSSGVLIPELVRSVEGICAKNAS